MEYFPRWLKGLIILVVSAQLSTCGTLIHPERRGQLGGRLDPEIVVLDAVGLLFFIIPGLIAFIVDTSNGTIYLPGGSIRGYGVRVQAKAIHFDPTRRSPEMIRDIIRKETGYELNWGDPRLRVTKLQGVDDIPAAFARAGLAVPEQASLLRGNSAF